MWPRILPFAVYMGFIAVIPLVTALFPTEEATQRLEIWLYPIKALVVGGLLVYFWSHFDELKSPLLVSWSEGLWTVVVGLLVYALWVRMDWSWAIQGELSGGYNPFENANSSGMLLAGIRLFGARSCRSCYGGAVLAVLSHSVDYRQSFSCSVFGYLYYGFFCRDRRPVWSRT